MACVLDENQVKLKLLHPPGPSNSLRYPPSERTITVAIKDVLTIVDPRTRTGQAVTGGKISLTEVRIVPMYGELTAVCNNMVSIFY